MIKKHRNSYLELYLKRVPSQSFSFILFCCLSRTPHRMCQFMQRISPHPPQACSSLAEYKAIPLTSARITTLIAEKCQLSMLSWHLIFLQLLLHCLGCSCQPSVPKLCDSEWLTSMQVRDNCFKSKLVASSVYFLRQMSASTPVGVWTVCFGWTVVWIFFVCLFSQFKMLEIKWEVFYSPPEQMFSELQPSFIPERCNCFTQKESLAVKSYIQRTYDKERSQSKQGSWLLW